MSRYNKLNFVSPEPVFAEVKEELRSYFDTGIVDDILFPVYTAYTLRKLGNGTSPVLNIVLALKDFSARLPDNFYKVRELYVCHPIRTTNMILPAAIYHQSVNDKPCEPDSDKPIQVIKTTAEINTSVSISHLLRPGNLTARDNCDSNCSNLWANCPDSFDIRDGYLYTNFASGHLYLIYYAHLSDDSCQQLIPDLIEFKEYLKSYIKFKCFETVFNNTTDETFRQIESKLTFYKAAADENFIIAKTEIMKETPYQKMDAIKRQAEIFRKYEIR